MSEHHTTLPENIRQLLNLPGGKISLKFIEDFTNQPVPPIIATYLNIYLAFTDTVLKKICGKSVNASKPKKFKKWYKQQKPPQMLDTAEEIIDALSEHLLLLPIPNSPKLTLNTDALTILYHEIKMSIALYRIKHSIGNITCGTPLKNADLKKICDAFITKQEFINMGLIGHTEEFYLR